MNQAREDDPSTSTPLVSIIIPTYNYGRFICDALDSVSCQTYANIEIVVVDDGSTDETASAIAAYHRPIKYIYQENAGPSAARNKGLAVASGRYLQFLDADDLIPSTAIADKVKLLEDNPNVSMAISAFRQNFITRNYLSGIFQFLKGGWVLPEDADLDSSFFFQNLAPPSAYLIRKQTLDDYGLQWDEDMRWCEDYDLFFAIFFHTGVPIVSHTHVIEYRIHDSNAIHNSLNLLRGEATMIHRIDKMMQDPGILAPEKRPIYLFAHLAAAVVCHFRLRSKGDCEHTEQLERHIYRIADEVAPHCGNISLPPSLYLSQFRLFISKSLLANYLSASGSIETIRSQLIRSKPIAMQYLWKGGAQEREFNRFIRLAYRDLSYYYIRARYLIGF